ncbi:GNAT family N-acetyltransferase [Alkalicoccobacillus murimartini]|uniref:GNAT superfamily N-acetyltransferase n=1 Tax=Alkalicoccobacillus murimartini TaxID=171685 RepID=A0ABT9YLV8_9BACI|nr:GNAT family N-acetyltransferase [Alkalicoccobacillus murimartini]MDQ0208486.1 GNAT superfamily N-acetyltransferase [Alkalicoccobacillus murimartini]
MIIRALEKHDPPHLTHLMEQLGYPASSEELIQRFRLLDDHSDYHTLVVEWNDQLIGFAGLHRGLFYEANGSYVRIVAFVVDESIRRKGVGKKLIQAIEEWAIAQNISTLVLNSGNREERQAAHHFYTQMGFKAKSTGFSKSLI